MTLKQFSLSILTRSVQDRSGSLDNGKVPSGKPIRRHSIWFRATLILVLVFCISSVVVAAPGDTEKPAGDWKPRIHFYAGPKWNNDPNGPILLNGQYHMYFQYNPFGDQWGHMSWGHAVSRDLTHWSSLPVALPEESGIMIFSGSVVEDKKNTSGLCGDLVRGSSGCLVAVYAGDAKTAQGQERQTQNLAFSRDGGTTWTKYSKNPILDLALKDFRDPKVFWYEPSQSWVMVLVLADQHIVQFYRSQDLKHWKLASKFGPAGATGGVWECPDLMQLAVRDAKGRRVGSRWVLSVNLNPGGVAGGSGNQYFVGQFDGTRFAEDHPSEVQHWVDWGKDFYASTSFANVPANEDRLWIAWMSNWSYAAAAPSLPGRGEMTVARRLYLRQIEARSADGPLALVQVPELSIPIHAQNKGPLTIDEANTLIARGGSESGVYLLRAEIEPGAAPEVGIRLRRSALNAIEAATEETIVGIDRTKGQIFVDRKRSGYVSFSPDFPARTAAPLKHPEAKAISIEIIVDRNSVEVFAEDGETVLSNLIFPSDASQGLAFYATGATTGGKIAQVRDLELVPLK
jgi:sucrose-6-phosphate hydrolase SacC (GH32 family)